MRQAWPPPLPSGAPRRGYREAADLPRDLALCSALAVPLVIDGAPAGVLSVFHDRPHRFSDDEKRLITALASFAAGALQNARLYARVFRTEERYGLRFADLQIGWWDGLTDRELEVKVMLDVLAGEGPALPGPRMRQLAQDVLAGIGAHTKGERFRQFRRDPYVNALQVKYAYAVTGHKAQGGQWKSVFVDQGYVTEEMIDREYVRWLYTAVTRASGKLYLLNFHPRFFGGQD